MAPNLPDEASCHICNKTLPMADLTPAEYVRESISRQIKVLDPDWDGHGYICYDDLNRLRALFVQKALEDERGELSILENQVLESFKENETLTANINKEFDRSLSFGERMADKLADFGGSWVFIISFGAVILTWIALNTFALGKETFDPYPYILLNLVLSCLASLQAPIIMMSQNRQEARDRLRAENDYRVNLKAELEIRTMNEKMDHMLSGQWQKLLEIQEIQTELMEEIVNRFPKERQG